MRRRFLFGLAIASSATFGCASTPPPPVPVAAAPMYSNQEWSQMNAETSVPEIPDDQPAAQDAPTQQPADPSQSGHAVYPIAIVNGAGNTAGSSTGAGVGATAQAPTVRPTIGPLKPKSH
jgi:hypothetical protein